ASTGSDCYPRDVTEVCSVNCLTDADCTGGEVCGAPWGIPSCVSACTENRDCSCGRACASGRCVRPACRDDEDCPRHMACGEPSVEGADEGGCRLIDCATDAECPNDTFCVTGRCAEELGQCRDTSCA